MSSADVDVSQKIAGTVRGVFLSYVDTDRESAQQLAEALRAEGLAVYSPDESPLGADVLSWVVEAIAQSDAVIFLFSNESASSANLGVELAYALAARLHGDPVRIVPVILDPDVELPSLARGLTVLDLSDRDKLPQAAQRLAQELRIPLEASAATPEEEVRLDEAIDLRRRGLELEIAEYEMDLVQRRERVAALMQSVTVGLFTLTLVAATVATGFFSSRQTALVLAATSVLAAFGGAYIGWFWRLSAARRQKIERLKPHG